MIIFNTHRMYSSAGQRIAATQVDGKTYFVDKDRMIGGVFIEPVELTQRAVMQAYDDHEYNSSNHPILRELNDAIAFSGG
jgi:hypothetical protein